MSRPPSSRTTTWELTSDAQREHWDAWAAALSAARHPSLARVEDVSRTQDLGTLVLADPDSESVTEWAERTGASVPERLSVLRAAAAALDALYAGHEGVPGIPHGGVSTASIRVASDGAARLVGFAPSAGSEDARFLAPELSAGSVATRAADAFAFARLTAVVLGGAKVAAAPDVPALSQALRSSPDTRRRSRLIKAIVSALTDPPEVRPHPLTAWLAAAVEGTAATEVARQVLPASDDETTSDHPPVAFGRRWPVLIPAIVVILLGVGIAGWVHRSSRDSDAHGTSNGPASGPIMASTSWAPACGHASGVAAAETLDDLGRPTSPHELDEAATVVAGGRWHQGRLLISLTAGTGDEPVLISSIKAVTVHPADAPAWIARPPGTCADDDPTQARWGTDLDKGSTTLVADGSPDVFTEGSFVLHKKATVIALDVTACRGNYLWQPVISYSIGAKHGTRRLDPVYTYGFAANVEQWQLSPGTSAASRLPGQNLTGADPACPTVD